VHEKPYWLQPMYHGKFKEAACNDCHGERYHLNESKTWSRANEMFIRFGCHGCHLVKGYENIEKVGPDLRRIAAKVNPEWLVAWIENPQAYNPHSKMPNFRLSHDDATAIAAFVLKNSEANYRLPENYPGPGSAAEGKELVETIGCRGCHVIADADREAYEKYREKDRPVKDHGPQLTRVA